MTSDALTSSLERELGLDPIALRAKYRAERDKRIRTEASNQYIPIAGQFCHYREDPHRDPGASREPLTDEVDVVIVGAGFSGLLLGAQLRKAGIESLRFVERGSDFGGTWYWNRYPGAACDTESLIYLPLLEELGYIPTRRYARAPEIFEHCQRIADAFNLRQDACFQTEVNGLRWDDAVSRWIVSTDRGDAIRARYVAVAPGIFDHPKLAGIPGIENFQGHSFHTSRWDYTYTGGTADGALTNLRDKTVGIIGTGATAVQCVPHLAKGAKHLYVFQRTPSSVDVRNDSEISGSWADARKPGWQQERIENFTALVMGGWVPEDLVNDGWTSLIRNAVDIGDRIVQRGESLDDVAYIGQLADFKTMTDIRSRVDANVEDEDVAASLKPWYDRFCKRPCFHDDYLPTFNRPNVTLVDTAGRGVDAICESGVIVDGQKYDLDCLIYSTGFDISKPFAERLGFPIVGRGATTLTEKFGEEGPVTQHGIGTNGFPNLFLMTFTQFGFSLNFTHWIAEQAKHVGFVLGRAVHEGITTVEVTRDAELAWVAEMDKAAQSRAAFLAECTPSYFNFEGDLARLNARNSYYGGDPLEFYRMLAEWRRQPVMAGFALADGDGAR